MTLESSRPASGPARWNDLVDLLEEAGWLERAVSVLLIVALFNVYSPVVLLGLVYHWLRRERGR